ncbi:hypothetical protein CL42_14435 [Acinetobacter sp. Ver3]|nr:hypothetical protein CL42_14435 [Acinetobacter sp. Ver3]
MTGNSSWHGKPHLKQDQIGILKVWPILDSGRSLEHMSDCMPRGMIVLDRTRLIGSLQQILIKQCRYYLTDTSIK